MIVYPADVDVADQPAKSDTPTHASASVTPPVSEGDLLDVVIDTLGAEGDGIAKVDGYTVFVPDGEPGDDLTVEITTVKQRYAFATIRASGGGRSD